MTARWAVVASLLTLAVANAQLSPRVFVVVFDDEHLSPGGLKRLQAAAALFANQFQPGDLGGVVVDGRLVGDRLLSNRDDLTKAITRAHPRLASAADLAASAASPAGVEQSARLAEIDALDMARAALDRKLASLEALVANLVRIDGAKMVILAAESFGGDSEAPRVAALADAAKRADVRFHDLDDSGSDRDAASGLARLTGGVIVHKAIDFAPAIARIVAGSRTNAVTAAPRNPVAPEASVPAAADATPTPAPATDSGLITSGSVVAAPSATPGLLHVRPLAESHVTNLAGGDWSDGGARAGWEAYQRGDLESARAALTPLALRPVAPSWIEYVVGQADYGLGQFKEAAVAWERVRARQPQFQPVYLDLADNYGKLNDRRKAIDVLREARRRWPKDADVLNALAVMHAGGGALDEAIKVLGDAIAAAPQETISYLNLAKAQELEYLQKRRNLQMMGWGTGAAEERERQEAMKNYRHYLSMAGPYTNLAREGIQRLQDAGPLRPRH